MFEHEVSRLASVDQLVHDASLLVHRDVGLRDDVLIFLPGGEVEGIGLMLDQLAALLAQLFVLFLHLVPFDVLAHLPRPVAAVRDGDVVHDSSVAHLAIGAFDKAVLIDPRVAGERGNQPNVRALRRLDGADPAVVCRVDVADLEPGALAGEAARPQRRQAPLVGDLRKRVGLVHELGELRGTKKLPDRGHDRLGVDQVVRHGGGHLLVDGHLLLDGPLHAHQADAELVFEQLAHGAHPPVPQVVDVVHAVAAAGILAQFQEVTDGRVEVLRIERPLVQGQLHGGEFRMVRRQRSLATPDHFRADVAIALPVEKLLMVDDQVEILRREVPRVQELEGAGLFVQPGLQLGVVAELDIELEPAHAGEVVLAGVEEHAIEERRGGVGGGRVPRPHLSIQFDQRFLGRFEAVAGECLADDRTHVVALREEDAQLGDAGILDRTERARGERVVGFQEHFAGRGVHDVDRGKGAIDVVRGDFHLRDMRLLHLLEGRCGDFPSRLQDRFMRAGVLDLLRDFPSLESLGDLPV